MTRLLSALPWLLLLCFPAVELGAHAWSRAHVPDHRDYEAAAAFVRTQFRPRDLIAAAPEWTDPIVREVLGDHIDLAMAGRSDHANYERLWTLSIRGAAPPEVAFATRPEPNLKRTFGQVTVQRWELGPSPVLYHFTAHADAARVELIEAGQTRACATRRHAAPQGGGLGVGVLPPRERVVCEGAPASVWVAPVVVEDLWLRPRHCIFQPVAAPAALRVTFDGVPLGAELVFYGGLYYEDERMRRGAPVTADIAIDGRLAAQFTHADGEGWKPMWIRTSGGTGRVSIEVRADDAHKRRFCWDATTRIRTPHGRDS